MTSPTTLRALLASKDFSGYRVSECEWSLDADEIERLLYGRQGAGYPESYEHERAFYEAAATAEVSLNEWTCTDTTVGLTVLLLGGEPIAICWQIARKSDRETVLLDAGARKILEQAWEACRPAPDQPEVYISEEGLDMPIAAPGADPFRIDESAPAHALRLSPRGIAAWIVALEPAGGLEAFTDLPVLRAVLGSAELCLEHARAEIGKIEEMSPEVRERMRAHLDDYLPSMVRHVETVEGHFVDPLSRRIRAIEATDAGR